MKNTIVARFADGSMTKGVTTDFSPKKDVFHIKEAGSEEIKKIDVASLKAVFFVKSYTGDKDHREVPDADRAGLGKKIMVTFKDGEIILGFATSYSNASVGFFVFPADSDSNNDRIFVINAATKQVKFL